MMNQSQRVFISYQREDAAFAEELRGWLLKQEYRPWMDIHDIPAGARWPDAIDRALNSADVVLGIMTVTSLASENVKNEWDWAIANERRLILILAEQCRVPFHYVSRNYVDFTTGTDEGYDLLGRQLQAPQSDADSKAPSKARQVQMVAREREQAMLRHAFSESVSGNGGLVVISGEAGIGKTTLVSDLLEHASHQGALILSGGCYDLTSTPPYGPWFELLEDTSAGMDSSNMLKRVQELGDFRTSENQQRFFEAVMRVVQDTASRQPLVAVLEDLHWSDPDSLDLLRFVARKIATIPVLLFVTYRDDELTRRDPLYRLLPALVREAGAERIRLDRLSGRALRELVDRRYEIDDDDAGRLVDYLDQAAEGNPLFVQELLRTLEERGFIEVEGGGARVGALDDVPIPELVQQLIDLRVDELDERVQEQLEVASIIGQTVQVDLWAAVASVDARDLFNAMERGARAGILTVNDAGTAIRFTHALLREALYERIFPPRRRELHRSAGEALAAQSQPNTGAIADHFERCGDPRTIDWLIRAADHAMRFAGTQTGIDRYERALTLLEGSESSRLEDQGWLLAKLGLLNIGSQRSLEAAGQYATRAAQVADQLDAAPLRAFARWVEVMVQLLQGQEITAASSVATAWETLSREDRAELTTRLQSIGFSEFSGRVFLAWTLTHSGRYQQANAITDELLEQWDPATAGMVVNDWLHVALAFSSAALGNPERAREAFRRHSEYPVGWMPNYSAGQDFTIVHLVYYADNLQERRDLQQKFNQSRNVYLERGFQLPGLAPPEAWAAWLEGRWDQVRDAMDDDHGFARWAMFGVFASLARGEGNHTRAWAYVDELIPKGPAAGRDDIWFDSLLPLHRLAGDLAMDEGNLNPAREWIEANQRWLDETGRVQGRAENHLLWARYYDLTGDQARSRTHAEQALEHASDPRQPLALLAAHRFLGKLNVDAGAFEQAADYLNQSLRLAEACEAPFEKALTLLELARLHAVTGDPDGVRQLLAEVREICEPLGARPALERVANLEAELDLKDE